MTVPAGGLGAFDMAVLPEVLGPIDGHGLSSSQWSAPRRRLLAELMEKGWLTLWPDLDGQYGDALWGVLHSLYEAKCEDVDLECLTLLMAELEDRSYLRSSDRMPGSYVLEKREDAAAALSSAHSKLEFDVVADCEAAAGICPVAIGRQPGICIEQVADAIGRLDTSRLVPRQNSEIVAEVIPLARRFPYVTVTGRYFSPAAKEFGFVAELLRQLVNLPVSVLRNFRLEFEGLTIRDQPAPTGSALRRMCEDILGETLRRAGKSGVTVEVVSWPEKYDIDLVDRHVVVGTDDRVLAGLTIGHVEREKERGTPGRSAINVMDREWLTSWCSQFRNAEGRSRPGTRDEPELQSWPPIA